MPADTDPLVLPKLQKAKVAGDGENPCHGLSGGTISGGCRINMEVTVVQDILCVLGILQNRKGKSIDGCTGAVVQVCKCLGIFIGDSQKAAI